MLHNLQVSTSALQPYHPQQIQPALSDLPSGSTVYARLEADSLFEQAELQSVDPVSQTASVTFLKTGVEHQVATYQVVQSVTLEQKDQLIARNSLSKSDIGSDVESLGNDMLCSEDEADAVADTAIVWHNRASLAVLEADMAASKVRSIEISASSPAMRFNDLL